MSSLIPWTGSRRNWTDPFWSGDLWDPFWDGGGDISGRTGWADRDDITTLALARVDWCETKDAHIFTAEIPGVRKEEVKVQVEDGNILYICGERTREEEDVGDTWHRKERRKGSFLRRFRLPENANLNQVKCSLDQGVLTVVVPKVEGEKPRSVRSIEVA